jgi:acyl carrier protein
MNQTIRNALRDALAQVAPEGDFAALDPGEPLRDQLELDSMDFLSFVIALHQRLGVDIPEADYPRLRTLEELARYLEPKVPA